MSPAPHLNSSVAPCPTLLQVDWVSALDGCLRAEPLLENAGSAAAECALLLQQTSSRKLAAGFVLLQLSASPPCSRSGAAGVCADIPGACTSAADYQDRSLIQ